MKKFFIMLTITFSLAFALCGCGGDTGGDSASDFRRSDSVSSPPTDQNPAAGEIHSLTDWYNSDERLQLEAAYTDQAKSLGLTYFVTVAEPDTLIFNYQYADQLDFGGASQQEIDTVYAQSIPSMSETFAPVFAGFQEEYGIPLSVIRFVYLNADGSLITTMDFSADVMTSDPSSGSSGAYGSLQDWIGSDAADAVIAETNNNLIYSGISFGLSADGNTLVYEYYVSDSLDLSSLPGEQLTEHLGGVVESQRETMLSLFDLFQSQYGLTLDAIRIVFFNEDGSKTLYTSDIP